MSKILKKIANDNVLAENTKKIANGETVQTETHQEIIEAEYTEINVMKASEIDVQEHANDNLSDDNGPNAPNRGALVPGLLRKAMANLVIPSKPDEWKSFYPAFSAQVEAKKAILNKAPYSNGSYKKCRHELMINAAQLLIMEAYLADYLRNVETHQGVSAKELAKMGLKSKTQIIKECGLTIKQYRDIKKLTFESVMAAIEFAFARREPPTRSMAFNKAMLKRASSNKKTALRLDPVMENEYKTLNLVKPMNATALCANISMGSYYLPNHNIHLKVCSEKVPERVSWLQQLNPTAECIEGDFLKPEVYKKVVAAHKENDCQLLIITCPCQDSSSMNTSDSKGNRDISRLFKPAVDFIKETEVPFFVFENVPEWYNSSPKIAQDILQGRTIWQYIQDELKNDYKLNAGYFSAADYGTCQDRFRGFVLGSRNGQLWKFPKKLPVRPILWEAIGNFKSLGHGENDPIHPWHYDDGKLEKFECEYLAHTPTGCSAWDNEPAYQPKNKDGSGSNGIVSKNDTRNDWSQPAHTITSGSGSTHSPYTIHPGHPKSDGTWTDPRVFSIAELLRIIGLPDDFLIPFKPGEKDRFIRKVFGEHLCPRHLEHLISTMPVPEEYLASDKQQNSKSNGQDD